MFIVVRPVCKTDLENLFGLAKEFALLNLPSNEYKLKEMIDLSEWSFSQKIEKNKREYIFVAEDALMNRLVAAAKIITKNGTPENPNIYYKILKKEKFSKSLGIGFTHQILQYCEDFDGLTELGGLIVARDYRGHPSKIGKLVSLSRFLYIAINRIDFKNSLHTELAPPLDSKRRSEFWEALGRRFTGLSYDEANRLSYLDKEFITSLFPENEIYTSLLDPKARIAIGQVGVETQPALRLMESFGFSYKHQIDPFDGGPHMGVKTEEAKPIKALKDYQVGFKNEISSDQNRVLLGGWGENGFRALSYRPEIQDGVLYITQEVNSYLNFIDEQKVFVVPFNYD